MSAMPQNKHLESIEAHRDHYHSQTFRNYPYFLQIDFTQFAMQVKPKAPLPKGKIIGREFGHCAEQDFDRVAVMTIYGDDGAIAHLREGEVCKVNGIAAAIEQA